jgi:uncharacterized protein (DUF1778 family)
MSHVDPTFSISLPGELKPLLVAAAASTGKSIKEFVRSAVEDASRNVVEGERVLSDRDRDLFLALDSTQEPNESLRLAFQRNSFGRK